MARPQLAQFTYLQQGVRTAIAVKLVVNLKLGSWCFRAQIAFDSTNIAREVGAPALEALTA
jgi:hypothetical protein